jgi:hypothetical protein
MGLKEINTLNSTNYHVDDLKNEESYYITDGVEGLERVAKRFKLSLTKLGEILLADDQFSNKNVVITVI